jgi:hypothetical protein
MRTSELQRQIDALRPADADYLILAVGTRGPNYDCDEGNAVATVRMGNDEATSEALHLTDAIALARGKIIREREAERKRREAEKAKPTN